jgi:Protein of unknown function (DUF1207)
MKCLVLILLLWPLPSGADTKWWSFDDRRYYEPLIAGVREAHLSALFLAAGDPIEFQVSDDDPRMIWDIDVGGELPVVGWESAASESGRLDEHEWGIGLWIPLDFHMVEDLSDRSGPIVNNDYRFGGMLKAQCGIARGQWLSARLHSGHESTHLGDEFSIVGQRQFPTTFERINVSWEYLDLGLLYERLGRGRFYSVRGGVTANVRDSYYETARSSITESRRGPVTPSTNRLDPYAGGEITWDQKLLEKWDIYISGELRWRSIYDYHKRRPDAAEDRQASVNLIVGIKANGENKASPFLRYYHGVNPHGQFRNQKDYSEIGLGIRLVR